MTRMISLLAVPLLVAAAPALAHPKLVSSNPAAGAQVAAPTRVDLTFNERLTAPLSGATIAMTGMGGKPHAPMAVSGTTSKVGPDGKSLILTMPKPLIAGTYRVSWHVVAADTHRITGTLDFTVK